MTWEQVPAPFPQDDDTKEFADLRDWKIIHVPVDRNRIPLEVCRWLLTEVEAAQYDTQQKDYMGIRYVLKAGGLPPPVPVAEVELEQPGKKRWIILPRRTKKGWTF